MSTLRQRLARIKGKSVRLLALEACWRAQRRWNRARFFTELKQGGCPVRFFNLPFYAAKAPCMSEEGRRAVIEFAEEICRGRYPFLGYGTVELGLWPQWNLDFVSGLDWPQIPSDNPRSIRHDGSDVKVPYELSRLQFLPILGKAHRLTGDDRYRTRAKQLISHWIENNPAGIGINWTMAMEVALRAMSMCFVLNLFWPMRKEEEAWLRTVTRSLWEHTLYIEKHIEFSHIIRSNHYLSNVVGLYCLSHFLRGESLDGKQEKYRRLIEREMMLQVYEDGGDYEASTGYHVLVTQMLTNAYLIMRSSHTPVQTHYAKRLRRMYLYLEALADREGTLPSVGDCDDGRTELLTDDLKQMISVPVEQRHSLRISNLLGLGAHLFGRADGIADDAGWYGISEYKEALGDSSARERAKPTLSVFPKSGVAVGCRGKAEVLFFAMPNGIHGKGSHTHNDKLSVVLRVDGREVLCDSGTYSYLRDVDARNRFRSTEAHNTVVIDEKEQNAFLGQAGLTFHMENDAKPTRIGHTDGTTVLSFQAGHSGYLEKCGVLHTRTVELHAADSLEIEDVFDGQGNHSWKANFHFAPSWRVGAIEPTPSGIVCKIVGPHPLAMVFQSASPLTAKVTAAQLSTTFGGKLVSVDKLSISSTTPLPARLTTQISWKGSSEDFLETFQESPVSEREGNEHVAGIRG